MGLNKKSINLLLILSILSIFLMGLILVTSNINKDVSININNKNNIKTKNINTGDLNIKTLDEKKAFSLLEKKNPVFVKTIGGSGVDTNNGISKTSDGGYIILGRTDSYGSGDKDVFVIKTDSVGNISWAKAIGGSGRDYSNSIQQTSDGGYIIGGSTQSYGSGEWDIFVIKLDSSGNLSWAKAIGGAGKDTNRDIIQNSDGDYIVIGYTGSYGEGNNDAFLIKLNSSGNLSLAKIWGGENHEEFASIQQTPDGSYVTMGVTGSYGFGNYDFFISKFNSSFNLSWLKIIGDADHQFSPFIKNTSDGGYIVIGYAGPSILDTNIVSLKLDSFGNLSWAKTIGGGSSEYGSYTKQTSDGGYILGGSTQSYGAGSSDALLVKLNSLGNLSWAKTIGGNNSDSVVDLKSVSNTGYVASGITQSYGFGDNDVFFLKLDSFGGCGSCSLIKDQTSSISISSLSLNTSNLDANISSVTPNITSVNPQVTSVNPTVMTQCFYNGPDVNFNNPTPSSGKTFSSVTNVKINSSINISDLNKLIFQWQGQNYTLYDNNLVLMMNLNNNSEIGENSTKAKDVSLFNNHGISNNVSFSSGVHGQAVEVSKDNALINISNSEEFNSENFTISLWADLDSIEVKDVKAFGDTSCVLLNSGEVYCVGNNEYGQLGDGTTTDRVEPVKVSGGYNFSELTNSGYPSPEHMCGIIENGSAVCWGRNDNGELGDNTTTNRNSPVLVKGNYAFSEISVGSDHTCGVLENTTENGSALCWGKGSIGQLGDGSTSQSSVPVFVNGSHNFSSISAGDNNVCGLLENGSAVCWGRNDFGQLGINITPDSGYGDTHTPAFVYGNYSFSGIYNGNDFACGILEDTTENGNALCWGQNKNNQGVPIGQLGDNSTEHHNVPVFVSGNYDFKYIEPHYHGACGLLENNLSMCWGNDINSGVLGINKRGISSRVPVYVLENKSFEKVSLGYGHGVGLTNKEKIVSWGKDSSQQLGKNFNSNLFASPILFSYGNISENSYFSVSVGKNHNCGLTNNGKAKCWGKNSKGQLGDNTTITREIPVFVSGNYSFSSISMGDFYHTCGLLKNTTENGNALCWGWNNGLSSGGGQLGDNSTNDSLVPVFVSGNYSFSQISPGRIHTCGLLENTTENGNALCWGKNSHLNFETFQETNDGKLGDNSTNDSLVPVFVSGNYNFSSISAGAIHTCGLLENNTGKGNVMCWGGNDNGFLGNGSIGGYSGVPVFLNGSYNFSSISVGLYHTCGLLENNTGKGNVMCWGNNFKGELGNGSIGGYSGVPVFLNGSYNFSDIKVGSRTSCGILENSSAMCWGDNEYGELGEGTIGGNSSVPVFVDINRNFSYIAGLGSNHVIGALQDGRIVGWGDNQYGQLGYSAFNNKIPTKGFYKGNLFGKSTNNFKLGQSFGGDLNAYTAAGFKNIDLNEGWNNIILSYDGDTVKVYINGSLKESFSTPFFSYPEDSSALEIVNGIRGKVDEVRMWNRTLNENEIDFIYNSNLNKKSNNSLWEFEIDKSGLNDGAYSYTIYAEDSLGNVERLSRSFAVDTSDDEDTSISGGGGGTPSFWTSTYVLNDKQIEEEFNSEKGFTRALEVKNRMRVKITKEDGTSEEHHVGVANLSEENKTAIIEVSSEPQQAEMSVGDIEKFDVTNDSYYDISVELLGIEDEKANITIKSIYEEIPEEPVDDTEENTSEDTGEDVSDTGEEEKSHWYYWVLGVIIVGLVVWYYWKNEIRSKGLK